jgi:glycosyltransferase involved in cell wall biosynthesis
MHIGLNILHLVPGETGGGETYVRRLVPALLGLDAGVHLTLFAAAEAYPSLLAEPWAGDAAIVRVPVRARSRARRVLAEQTLLPRAARRARVDLLHNTLNTAPVIPGVRQVTTIHDVIYKRFPETAGRLNAGVALLVPLAARRSSVILTDSKSSSGDISELLGVEPTRIVVAPLGPGLPEPQSPLPAAVLRERLELGDAPIVLTVAAKRPHKNLGRLLDAFARVETNAMLVIPGFATSHAAELEQRASDRVRFLGWVDDPTLDGLYRAATCFFLPSLAEGFGLPVLEAMVRGTPVACSDIPVLREVAGDAALYFDPLDPDAISRALEQLLDQEALRLRLRGAGRMQAREFSWERAAAATIPGYELALAGSSTRL